MTPTTRLRGLQGSLPWLILLALVVLAALALGVMLPQWTHLGQLESELSLARSQEQSAQSLQGSQGQVAANLEKLKAEYKEKSAGVDSVGALAGVIPTLESLAQSQGVTLESTGFAPYAGVPVPGSPTGGATQLVPDLGTIGLTVTAQGAWPHLVAFLGALQGKLPAYHVTAYGISTAKSGVEISVQGDIYLAGPAPPGANPAAPADQP